jgi:succinyl-diaminopimelate desuccinylase
MKAIKAAIVEAVEKREKDLNKLVSQLIRAKSENPPGDVSESTYVIENFLKDQGIVHQKYEPTKGHSSIVATIGKGKPSLIFCGHIDVVPAGDSTKWGVDPYSATVREGKLYGRGASDQKGGVAAQLIALAAATDLESQIAGKITVANVCDEEAQGPGGALWLLENRKLTGDMCLITEPTGNVDERYNVVAGERGTCWLRITAYGKPAHGSTPPLGRNAIEMLTRFLPKLKSLETEAVRTPRDSETLLRNGEKHETRIAKKEAVPTRSLTKALTHYTINVGVIQGGTKANVVPENCSAEIDIRVPVGGHPDGVEEFVRQLLPENFEYEVINTTLPSYTPAEHPLVKSIQKSAEEVFHYTPAAIFMVATSDAHFFREMLRVPTVSFGPGYGELCHAYDEYVLLKDVKNAAKVYSNVIANVSA